MREVEVVIEFGGAPDFADLDAAVVRGCILDKIRFLPVPEVEGQIGQEPGLISFDGKMVMSMAKLDQIGGELALGQQSIGGDILALKIDRLQQGNGDLDFIGPFDFFVAFYGEGDFFWV